MKRQANTVGGTISGAANVISGNFNGVDLYGSGTSGNVVLGNLIGTDITGTAKLGNAFGRASRIGATGNTVGGTSSSAANVISGNNVGVLLSGSGASGNVVLGNLIGTDINGTANLGNSNDGVLISNTATLNTVGGTSSGTANVISANKDGVYLADSGTSGNVVLGNLIGTEVNGTAKLGNSNIGVVIFRGATTNTVGGTSNGAGNVISDNPNGVILYGSGTSGNVVLGNLIGTDINGTVNLGNSNDGVVIYNSATLNTVGGTSSGAANVISGNTNDGVYLYGSGTTGNVVLGNLIGTDIHGTARLGNSDGVVIRNGATANTVGGTSSGGANVISSNGYGGPPGIGNGVYVDGVGTSGNVVLGNLIGTDIHGTAKLGNAFAGVFIHGGATDNTVGGTSSGAANDISGNAYGVDLYGGGTSGNVVLGNLIGTDIHGTAQLGNTEGVLIQVEATANTVGGTSSGAANVISGNDIGVYLYSGGTSGNVVLGNLIGTDIHGTAKLGNTFEGVFIAFGATGNTVGGTSSGAANVISANNYGVDLYGSGTSGNVVLGNLIGTDINGTANLGNTTDGVLITTSATANTVGGSAAGANVISGNTGAGVEFTVAVSSNTVSFNSIGTNKAQTAALANGAGLLFSESNDTIGAGSAADSSVNTIAGNATELQLAGNSNVLLGLSIGPAAKTLGLPNGTGVLVTGNSNTIGGTTAAVRNVISGNSASGVTIQGSANVVEGDYIGTDSTGTVKLGNVDGVLIQSGATANTIGGTSSGAANVISGNTDGVFMNSAGTSGNVVLGNLIGTDISGTANLGNTDGVLIMGGATGNTVGSTITGAANVISGNHLGVYLRQSGTSGNVVLGNLIGTDITGSANLGNNTTGVLIGNGATANTVGGTSTGAVNVISGNIIGVYLSLTGTSGNVVLGNLIGTDINGTANLGNTHFGVLFQSGASANTVGGTSSNAANVISSNVFAGVVLNSSGTSGNVVLGNLIGTDIHGTAKLGNHGDGVLIENGAKANTIGGTAANSGNTIAFNSAGVVVTDNTTTGESILGNSIFGNTSLGIDLGDDGPTPNGANPRSAPNDGQNTPVITSVSDNTINGTLTSLANTSFRLEFFASPEGSSYQGQTFLGSYNVSTPNTGPEAFSVTVASIPSDAVVTATATNLATGDTSEFCNFPTNQNSSSLSTTIEDAATNNPPPSGGEVLGSSVYDTATVTGSSGTPTGTVTYYFYTTASPVYGTTTPYSTQTVTLSGGIVPNSTATGALTAGGYAYIGVYSGDSNYASSVGAVEPLTVNQASPSISTSPDPTSVTLGTTAPTLTDSATLSSGYSETGSITFYLFYGPTLVDIESATISGDGSYATPTGYTLPTTGTVTGAYQWDVVYSGDAKNNAASDNNDPAGQVTVSSASPSLSSNPTNVTLATTAPTLTDSATLSGGYYETGSITFTLFTPSGTLVDTETDPVSGNGTYTTPTGYTLPTTGTVTGTYQWYASYDGDGNNNSASANLVTLASFDADPSSTNTFGANPSSGLIEDSAGNLFGTAAYGGAYGDGTIFEVAAGSGTITTLDSFNGDNGENPYAGLVEDSAGNLFGTAQYGGAYGAPSVVTARCSSGSRAAAPSPPLPRSTAPMANSPPAAWSRIALATSSVPPSWVGRMATARCSRWRRAAAPSPPWPRSTSPTALSRPAVWSRTASVISSAPPPTAEPAMVRCSRSRREVKPSPLWPISAAVIPVPAPIPRPAWSRTSSVISSARPRTVGSLTTARCLSYRPAAAPSPHWPRSSARTAPTPSPA